jgi:hypothetical protein
MFEELKSKYPLLFPESEMEPINLYGLEHSKGWNFIVEKVCELFYSRLKSLVSQYNHLVKLLEDKNFNTMSEDKLIERMRIVEMNIQECKESLPKLEQVKEKFGTLRIYVSSVTPYQSGVIDMAEEMSEHICEECGAAGKLYMKKWHKTLCPTHAIERYGEC